MSGQLSSKINGFCVMIFVIGNSINILYKYHFMSYLRNTIHINGRKSVGMKYVSGGEV